MLVVGEGLEVREEVEFGGERARERLGGEVDGGDPVRGVAFDAIPGAGIGAIPFGGDGGEGGHDGVGRGGEGRKRKRKRREKREEEEGRWVWGF
ncbi:hypothetical protein Acr_07g0005250 [Actinidia rufa]|uniref:Uncharacterized protein n=1 Tax=Actinidia rufa TaxID=165716 RepID=A0A7J0EVB2_9ERIC|nr:hypothetical protein Acr_07g0005250 [Actinidia rufa]